MKISRIQRLGVLFLCLRLAMPLGLRVGYLFQLCTRVCNVSCGRRWDHDEAKRVSQAKQRLNLCQFLLMRWCGDGSKPVCFSISSRLCIYIYTRYLFRILWFSNFWNLWSHFCDQPCSMCYSYGEPFDRVLGLWPIPKCCSFGKSPWLGNENEQRQLWKVFQSTYSKAVPHVLQSLGLSTNGATPKSCGFSSAFQWLNRNFGPVPVSKWIRLRENLEETPFFLSNIKVSCSFSLKPMRNFWTNPRALQLSKFAKSQFPSPSPAVLKWLGQRLEDHTTGGPQFVGFAWAVPKMLIGSMCIYIYVYYYIISLCLLFTIIIIVSIICYYNKLLLLYISDQPEVLK